MKPKKFLEHFWRNSGKIFRPFFGVFVARPKLIVVFVCTPGTSLVRKTESHVTKRWCALGCTCV